MLYKGSTFILISGIGWLLDFSIYTILIRFLSLPVFFGNCLSSIPAITFVFFISTKKTFNCKENRWSLKTKYVAYLVYQVLLLTAVSSLAQLMYGWTVLLDIVNDNILLFSNLKLIIKILITPITIICNFFVLQHLSEHL